jgi:hypothetical protein
MAVLVFRVTESRFMRTATMKPRSWTNAKRASWKARPWTAGVELMTDRFTRARNPFNETAGRDAGKNNGVGL